jgi:hydrogenase maturation protease
VSPGTPTPQILVAGVGNAWLGDDGFGSRVASRLERLGPPEGVNVFDFGTGGLDLAYEAMRGYDALVLVDVSRLGGEPGTLYVIEPDDEEIQPIEDGEVVNPHAMDPRTVLRFLKTVGGWPGKVVVVACEPATDDVMSLALSTVLEEAVDRAAELVLETVGKVRAEALAEAPS